LLILGARNYSQKEKKIKELGEVYNLNDKILSMIKARLEKGKRQYGEQLEVDDGREWLEEALEELLDAIVYLTAELLLIKKRRNKMITTNDLMFDELYDEFKRTMKAEGGDIDFEAYREENNINHDTMENMIETYLTHMELNKNGGK
tara:strand:- start:339 stop:779 length:441 start_codon:yes stop_codon:yes gene_type:complete